MTQQPGFMRQGQQNAAELRRLHEVTENLRLVAHRRNARITDLEAALRQASEALEDVRHWDVSNFALDIPVEIRRQMQTAIVAAKQALGDKA